MESNGLGQTKILIRLKSTEIVINKRKLSIFTLIINGFVEHKIKILSAGQNNHFKVWLAVNEVYQKRNEKKFKIDELRALILKTDKTETSRLLCKSLQKLNLASKQYVKFSKYEVISVSSFIKFLENSNDNYEALIKIYDGTIGSKIYLESRDASYINNGWGRGSLRPKRVIELKDYNLFEKCYFLNSVEFKKFVFVNDYVLKHIKRKNFVTPLVKDLVYGERLVLTYSEEISASRYNSVCASICDDVIELAVDFNLAMLELDVDGVIPFFEKSEILNNLFLQKSSYGLFVRLLKKRMFSEMMFIRKIENLLDGKYYSIAHGDFSFPNNVALGRLIFDWDDLCIQPYGYDLGYLLALKVEPKYFFKILHGVRAYCVDKLSEDKIKYFVRGVIYFYIIFHFSRDENFKITLRDFLKCLVVEVEEFKLVENSVFIN